VGFLVVADSGFGELSQTLAHPDEVTGLVFGPDGRTVVTACRDQQVRYWDRQSATVRRSYRAHVAALSCLALSADRAALATGGAARSVKLWDGSIGRLLTARAVLPDGQGPATFAAWAGGNLVSGDGKQWRCRAAGDLGRRPVAFASGFGCVLAVARSPDGTLIATGHEDTRVRLWDAATGKLVQEMAGHELPVWAVA